MIPEYEEWWAANYNSPTSSGLGEAVWKAATEYALEIDRERLAAEMHEIWADWMQYLFQGTIRMPNDDEVIEARYADWWKRQIDTPYEQLSEREKKSDRNQADKIIKLLGERSGDE